MFGGAIGDSSNYNITNDVFIMDLNVCSWKKLICSGLAPTPRAAHTSVGVNLSQIIVYGGSAGSMSFN